MIVKDMKGHDIDTKEIRGVSVAIECAGCKGRGRVPGGRYQSQGEVVNCLVCGGGRVTYTVIELSVLHNLLHDQIAGRPLPIEVGNTGLLKKCSACEHELGLHDVERFVCHGINDQCFGCNCRAFKDEEQR